MLNNGLCLSAKPFKYQNNLVTMSFMIRKWNVVMIETKLETIDQLTIGERVSFLAERYNICTVNRLSEEIDCPNHRWFQFVRVIGVLLYIQ